MIRVILVPLDGSRLAERALPWAETLTRATGGSLSLLRVVTDFHKLPPALSRTEPPH